MKAGVKFEFSDVNTRRRSSYSEPFLTATSTKGVLRISATLSKAMKLKSGDYVMFLSNVDGIDKAIADENKDLVAFCESHKLEFGSVEANIALHNEFDCIAIAKGIPEYNEDGSPKTVPERLTEKTKRSKVISEYNELIKFVNEKGSDYIKAKIENASTKEEKIEILTSLIVPSQIHKYKGSKTSSQTNLNGLGCNLMFSDTNMWFRLKSNCENVSAVNRIYSIDTGHAIKSLIFDGYKNITVPAFVLSGYEDRDIMHRGETSVTEAE